MRTIVMLGVVALAVGASGAPWCAETGWDVTAQPDLKQQLDAAPRLQVEDVCAPVKTTKVGETMRVPNPGGGLPDLLQWYWRGYGGPTTLFILDLATGEVKQDSIPLGRQIHVCGHVLGRDGKRYITTPDWQKGMELYVYDPAKNELEKRGVIAPGLGGESRPMCLGTDGKIYGGGSYADTQQAGAYQIDTDTGKITLYGRIGPSHSPMGCWCQSLGADDEWVYVPSGKVPWYLIAYNRQTGEQKVLLETERVNGIITVSQLPDGCMARASRVLGAKEETTTYWLYKGQAIPKTDENPPWPKKPAPAVNPQQLPSVELYTELLDPDTDGNAALWYRDPANQYAKGSAPADATPEQLGWKCLKMKVDLFPMPIRRLTEMPDGRLWGTADVYLGNFLFDPATGKCEHLGKCALSHYSTAFADGKVYMSGYPSSPVYVYDLSKPWIIGHGTFGKPAPGEMSPASNPRLAVRLSDFTRCHKMFAAAVGADGKIYFGGQTMRVANGGGIGWWDPKTEKAGGIWEPFTAYEIHFMVAAEGGKYLVASGTACADESKDNRTPDQGKLFVFDVAQGKIVRDIEPVMKAPAPGPIVEVAPGRILGTCADPNTPKAGLLYGVDIHSGKVLFTKQLPYEIRIDLINATSEFRMGPDGFIWTYQNDVLVRINPANANVEVVGKMPAVRIAFAGKDIYLAGSDVLRRVRGVVK